MAGKMSLLETPVQTKYLRKSLDGRNSEFRKDHAILVLGVPDVVIIKPIDVHIQPTIIVHVNAGYE